MPKYSVLLVDDEKYVRLWLKNCIDWATEDFEIIGEAANGSDAFKMTEELRPDLIISDMEMTGGDGAVLMRQINECFPDICLIVLSGYDKFEYVRSAVLNKAVDYLLKPLKPDTLKDVLSRARTWIDVVRDEKAWLIRVNRENEDLRQAQIINRLLGGIPADSELINLLGLRRFWLAAILESRDQAAGCRRLLSDAAKAHDLAFISAAVNSDLICVLGGDSAEKLSCFLAKVSETLPCSAAVYSGLPKNDTVHIASSYTEARIAAIEAKPGSGRYFVYHTPERHINAVSAAQERRLLMALHTQDSPQVFRELNNIFESVNGDKLLARYAYTKMIAVLIRFGFETGMSFEMLGFDEAALFARAGRAKTVDEFKEACKEMLDAFLRMIGELNTGKEDTVAAAKSYIAKNYSRDVSLDEIARYTGISPNYLCNVFKHETGESVFDYIASIRIDEAKSMLQNNMKVYETAKAVGYSDAKYFGRVFKKITGLSPGEYKERSQKQ